MIALLSNITIDSLAQAITKATGEETYTSSGYNTWAQELLSASFGGGTPDCVFLILDGTQLMGDAFPANWESAQATLDEALSVIIGFASSHKDIPIFVSSLDIPNKKIQPYISARIEHKAESYWLNVLEENGTPVLDIKELTANVGRDKFYSYRMWYLGSIPYSMTGEKAIAEEISYALNSIKGRRAKCIVLDLDNTLWGGVIGEDGIGGIELSTTKEGSRYRDFQKRIKEIKEEGAILAVVSKNNIEDALDGINNHPDMILREKDFVAIKANWEPKPVNIGELAKELNIGLDSFVFIDDNPIEREAVKTALPQVIVPEFPKDTANLEKFAIEIGKKYFPTLKLTKEDTQKTEQYQIEHKRSELKKEAPSLEDYLKSLEMKLTIREITEEDIPRAAQLTQKTNQFNLTTRRYTESDIRRMKEDKNYKLWIGELEDKFGSYGKVILAIVRLEPEHRAVIDTFLMSCRVMGRNVETDFLKHIEQSLKEEGIREIIGEYIETPKNKVVKEFWSQQAYKQSSLEDKNRSCWIKETL
ncbi:HAD-IIIC family phosphatase [uncultured Cloacibacillus sp.]|uniref:HAD-IIIC family phosphatase n=1 Tax=uncultured Cloacibacillus sp. TaxID=889794 RepID=UPI00320798D0